MALQEVINEKAKRSWKLISVATEPSGEVRRIVDESYDTAEDVLVRNRELLEKLAAELIEFETVDARHLKRLVEEPAVDKVHFEEPSRNGYQRR